MIFQHCRFQFLEAGSSIPFRGAWFFVAFKYLESPHVLFSVSVNL
jgi:hypothetical protein